MANAAATAIQCKITIRIGEHARTSRSVRPCLR
jgi:hypothetical protein